MHDNFKSTQLTVIFYFNGISDSIDAGFGNSYFNEIEFIFSFLKLVKAEYEVIMVQFW